MKEIIRKSMKELQNSMDEEFKQVMKKIDVLRSSNGRVLEVISEMKISGAGREELKTAEYENPGNDDAHKVFDKRSTRGTSNRKVLISSYNQNEDCLYVETLEYVSKKILISDFNQDENCWCVETYENVTELNFLELPKEEIKSMVDGAIVHNKVTDEGNEYREAAYKAYEVFNELFEEDHMAYTSVVIECAKTCIQHAYWSSKSTCGMLKVELKHGGKKLFIFDPGGGESPWSSDVGQINGTSSVDHPGMPAACAL